MAIDDAMYLIYPLREEWFSLITEKVTRKPLSVEAPLCSRICAWKNPQVARTLIDTHFPSIYMDNLVVFKLFFFVIEVPINAMTTAPAHPTLTSNRLCSTADVCVFHGGIFYIQARQGGNFPRY